LSLFINTIVSENNSLHVGNGRDSDDIDYDFACCNKIAPFFNLYCSNLRKISLLSLLPFGVCLAISLLCIMRMKKEEVSELF
jgi:hypothetical protein